MVSTRRQTRKRKSDGDTVVETSPTTKSATTGVKRQKNLPVRAKDEPKLKKGAVEEAEADEEEDDEEENQEVASSPRQTESSFVVEIRAKTDADSEKGMDDSREGEELITGDEQPAPEPEIEEASSQAGSDDDTDDKGGNGDEEPDEDDQDETPDDDLAAAGQPTALATSISEPSDDESDSDAAPEAVSTSKAATQALESAKAANKAVAEQAKTQKRKRQERAARLQEQAQSRKEAAPQKTGGGAATGTGSGSDSISDDDEADDGGLDEVTPRTQLTQESNAAFSARRKREQGQQLPTKTDLTKPSVPHVLPAEYLDSDSEEEVTGEDLYLASLGSKPPRKARKLATAERNLAREARRGSRPQEKVVGSTVYRVAGKKRDERLAPKGAKASANAKNGLLSRGRAAVKPKGGFFVK